MGIDISKVDKNFAQSVIDVKDGMKYYPIPSAPFDLYGVFHDGDGQAGGDVLHAGAVLLGLLDAGVHEHGAAGAQVHGLLGEQAQLGEGGNVIAQGLGKGLDKGAAAGGAGLVEHDGVHRAVADFKALHVLTADVDDELNVGHEIFSRRKVSNRLNNTDVDAESVSHHILSVTRYGA